MLFRRRPAHASTIRSILIVEDEPLIAFENELSLADAGYAIAATVNTAPLAIARIGEGGIDLVLTDVKLAGGSSGIDVARYAHERQLPVLYATGNCPGEAHLYATGCLIKPYGPQDLVRAIRAIEAIRSGETGVAVPGPLHLYARDAGIPGNA